MKMFDLAVFKKTVKVIVQMIAITFITCVLVLLITSFCQQRVYNNTNLNRNAYVEIFQYVIGKK